MNFRFRGAKFAAVGAFVALGAVAAFSGYKSFSESRRADTAEAQLRDLRIAVAREALVHALDAHVYSGRQKEEFVPNCMANEDMMAISAKFLEETPEGLITRLGGKIEFQMLTCLGSGDKFAIPVSRTMLAGARRLISLVSDPEVLDAIQKLSREVDDGIPSGDPPPDPNLPPDAI